MVMRTLQFLRASVAFMPVPVPATYSLKLRDTTLASSPMSWTTLPGGHPVPAQVTSIRELVVLMERGGLFGKDWERS